MGRLVLKELNKDNVKTAGSIQYEIFPNSAAYIKYLEEIENKECDYRDFLIYLNNKPIGVIGYSADKCEKNTAWLSWFGVLKEYRGKGFGKIALKFICELLEAKGYKTLRLFTYEVWNREAQPFYKNHMDIGEYYVNDQDNQYDITVGKCKIFSKSLNGDKILLWNNKFINIGEEDILHEISIKKLKEDGVIN